ncbi:hypothetical protein GIS00_02465 [Nakamurella sp. YIM 132087]|uniref:Uncharacterized protein n=1 Tax=Nakamurella alba TaxID=2665158 RepID=A0A7K1FFD2_9ACTN|nr:hypothetical protein [Nakamurella alba]MTD12808.1 hypothetical protein [Nakamurella alba]
MRRRFGATAGLIALTVLAAVATTVYLVIDRSSITTFPGTTIEYRDTVPSFDVREAMDCVHYTSTLEHLVGVSSAIVVGEVVASRPLFEATYGVADPQEDADGNLPEPRLTYLDRELTIAVEQTLFGEPVTSLKVLAPGWYSGDPWEPTARFSRSWLQPGDRAVIPVMPTDPPLDTKDWPEIMYTCSGPFVLENGRVVQKEDTDQFVAEGVWSMSEQQLVDALRAEIG